LQVITDDAQLPSAIDIWLMSMGFYKSERAPGSKRNAKVTIQQKKEKYVAWKSAYEGEDPPF